jgi:hypothetical protein
VSRITTCLVAECALGANWAPGPISVAIVTKASGAEPSSVVRPGLPCAAPAEASTFLHVSEENGGPVANSQPATRPVAAQPWARSAC